MPSPRTATRPGTPSDVDALLADVRRADPARAAAADLRAFHERAVACRDALAAQSAALERTWGASLLDASAEDAATHDAQLRALAHDRRRAEVLVEELERRQGAAETRERDASLDTLAARVREGRLDRGPALLREADKALRKLGTIFRELETLTQADQNLLNDLEHAGRRLDAVLGDDLGAHVGPPGALRCYRGQLLQELVPFLPSAFSPEPVWGQLWGEDPEAEAARRERAAEQLRGARQRQREAEASGPAVITYPAAGRLRTLGLGSAAGDAAVDGAHD